MSGALCAGTSGEYPVVIEPTPLNPAGRTPALKQLRQEYHSALAAFDLRRSRELVLAAAEGGLGLGRIYVDVVRPSLRAVAHAEESGGSSSAGRLVLGSVRATLAVLASQPATGAPLRGDGRSALVAVGGEELDELDGQVIMDVLGGDGWSVEPFTPDTDAEEVAAMASARRAQLVIMPTSRPADLLRAATSYTLLRRLADPPIIIACSFGHPDETARARAAGADAFANDPDALLATIDRRLPAHRGRPWGVHLRRLGGTLVVVPTGDLNAEGVSRLRAVADSRIGSFERLIVDAREVGSADELGAEDLVAWLHESAAAGRSHRLLAGEHVGPLLGGLPVDAAMLADAAETDAR